MNLPISDKLTHVWLDVQHAWVREVLLRSTAHSHVGFPMAEGVSQAPIRPANAGISTGLGQLRWAILVGVGTEYAVVALFGPQDRLAMNTVIEEHAVVHGHDNILCASAFRTGQDGFSLCHGSHSGRTAAEEATASAYIEERAHRCNKRYYYEGAGWRPAIRSSTAGTTPEVREHQPPRVAHQPCPDLDGLDLDAAQRPVPDRLGQGQPQSQVPQVVCQHEQPPPHLVSNGAESGAAFTDIIVGCVRDTQSGIKRAACQEPGVRGYCSAAKIRSEDRSDRRYSTVTVLARLRGWSTSQPRHTAMW